ncbi:signal peptidase I [Pseudomonas asplenii]|uniref:Signal peptidase I n=1 Tax=Pseudomonas asplenii TaxID=53407 RepID=A0A1H6P947_9PSED|nr:signal peptidase I [Pseudomonas fuscovaginae]SEI21075.1 signal peptidase I [Pseudomonas fuscovaginae]
MPTYRKLPLQAFVMSCLVAGWGLVYAGKVKWALRVALFLYAGIILLGVCGLIATPRGLLVLASFVVLVKLCSATAAALSVYRDNGTAPSRSKRFHLLYVGTLIVITGLIMVPFRTALLGYANYYIPSGSMVPTLQIGDYVVSDLRPGAPKVGDIVVYRYNGIEAVKRVAALPGDRLEIVEGHVLRNGENLGYFFAPADRVKKPYSLTLEPLQVQAGHVYLLGDNRDSSNDSRFMGQVPLDDLRGRVTGIWFSNVRNRIGTLFK